MTLGFDEDTIIERLYDALRQIISHERNYRNEAIKQLRLQVEDRVWRSAGTLSYARSISTDEAMQLLSDVRMGASLGLINIDMEKLNSLLWEIQPSNLIKASGKDKLSPEERDIRRAELLRSVIIK